MKHFLLIPTKNSPKNDPKPGNDKSNTDNHINIGGTNYSIIDDKVEGKIDEKQLSNLKRRAELLNKKLEELETTGKVFTKEEKKLILSEMVAILALIVGLPILSKLNLPKVPTLPIP